MITMRFRIASLFLISSMMIQHIYGISSPLTPFSNYTYSTTLQQNISDLWWDIDSNQQQITFELHIKTTGWIALGISPAGGMTGADIGVGWIDQTGKLHFQDRYAYGFFTPVIDNTTSDWFGLQGREQDGWTAIQFKRLIDTCDSMDVVIKSGSNTLIFAYGVVDPDLSQSNGDITYHDNRRGSRIIPLLSYSNPPSRDKFNGLRSFEFRASNYSVPPDNPNYYCEVFKVPNDYLDKYHAIAREIMITPGNVDILHHLILYECDPTAIIDGNNLPRGPCNTIPSQYTLCRRNIAIAWAIGGDTISEYPQEAGFPFGLNFSVQYYAIEIHYDISKLTSNRLDSSGIRFYVGNQLRQYDIGCFTLGVQPSPYALVIPPKMNELSVNSYCLANASLAHFSSSGLTVISAIPHTHLQGRKVWTKIIRNKTAVGYLFNGELYDFSYQFENRFPEPIKIYPGDEFATQCVYSTNNKNTVTLGGYMTTDEMCFHFFAYYPRMKDLYSCLNTISPISWQTVLNTSLPSITNASVFTNILQNINWTSDLSNKWQSFYDNAAYQHIFGRAGRVNVSVMPKLPEYKDLVVAECESRSSSADHRTIFFIWIFVPFFKCGIFIW